MEVTYSEIVSSKAALEALSKKELSVKEAVRLARLIKKLNSELEIFGEKQKEFCEKYGKLSEDGMQYLFEDSENRAEFERKMTELLAFKIDIGEEKISIKSDIKLPAADVINLETFIKFESEDNNP